MDTADGRTNPLDWITISVDEDERAEGLRFRYKNIATGETIGLAERHGERMLVLPYHEHPDETSVVRSLTLKRDRFITGVIARWCGVSQDTVPRVYEVPERINGCVPEALFHNHHCVGILRDWVRDGISKYGTCCAPTDDEQEFLDAAMSDRIVGHTIARDHPSHGYTMVCMGA